MSKQEEAEFSVLWGAGSGILAFVFMMLILVYGADIVTGINSDFVTGAANCNATHTTACGYAYNVSANGLLGMDTVGAKGKSMGSILAISIIIGLLVFAFGGFVGGRL